MSYYLIIYYSKYVSLQQKPVSNIHYAEGNVLWRKRKSYVNKRLFIKFRKIDNVWLATINGTSKGVVRGGLIQVGSKCASCEFPIVCLRNRSRWRIGGVGTRSAMLTHASSHNGGIDVRMAPKPRFMPQIRDKDGITTASTLKRLRVHPNGHDDGGLMW